MAIKKQDHVDLNQSRYYSRQLLRTLYDIQKTRISFGNRLKIDKDGKPQKGSEEYLALMPERAKLQLQQSYEAIEAQELLFGKLVEAEIRRSHLYEDWLQGVKGVGPLMAAVVLYEIDIHLISTVSALWAYAGVSPGETYGYVMVNSKTEFLDADKTKPKKIKQKSETKIRQDKKTAGFVCPYNQFLKTKLLGVLAGSFLKCKSPYADFYYNYKNRLQNQAVPPGQKPKTKSHIHTMALRYMIKMFLQDLYVHYRQSEGLPVSLPYAEAYLHRQHHGPTAFDAIRNGNAQETVDPETEAQMLDDANFEDDFEEDEDEA